MSALGKKALDTPIFKKQVYFVFYLLVFSVLFGQCFLLNDFYDKRSKNIVINEAGRLRMLSQRVAKNLLLLVSHQDLEQRVAKQEIISKDVDRLKLTQLILKQQGITGAEQLIGKIISTSTQIQELIASGQYKQEQIDGLIQQYLEHAQLIIPVMDDSVAMQQWEVEQTIHGIELILWSSIVGTILCCFLGVYFIVRPAHARVKWQINELAIVNDKKDELIGDLKKKNDSLKELSMNAKENEREFRQQSLLLMQQKQLMNAVLNSSHEAIISINSKGIISLFNQHAEKVFGYKADDVIGSNVNTLMPSPYSEAHDDYLQRFANTGKKSIIGVGREVRGKKKDNSTFPMYLRVVEIQTSAHHEFVGFVKDLSKIRAVENQARESDKRYKAVVEDQTDLICRYSADYLLTFVNQAYCRYFGYQAETIIGSSIVDLLPAESVSQFLKAHRLLFVDKPIHVHEDKVIHNGKQDWQHWLTRAIFSDDQQQILEFQAVGRVVTDRKEAEQSAILAKEAADKANKAKSQFLSSMSHELRTPLNSIIGFSQLMELDETEPLSSSQLDSVLQINKAGNHLLKLINEILDLSKIESGQVNLVNESFDLKTICDETLALIEALAIKKEITISAQCDDEQYWVYADYMRTKQVFLNLLSNAIKYNHEQGSVNIDVKQDKHFVVIQFVDSGVGISSDKVSDLFQPFNRLGYESSAIEGTGIGLSLTKRLVEQMGGEITVDSQIDIGSTFTVKLPVSSNYKEKNEHLTEISPPTVEDKPHSDKLFKILYIEDNPANLALMRRVIKNLQGFSLDDAVNAEIGIELFEQIHPDIVLMDIDLPGMNGFEALDEIKKRFLWAEKIPIIAISSNAMKGEVEKGKQSGFYDYLTQPVDIVCLAEILNKVKVNLWV